MRIIYKYPLVITDLQTVYLPKGAKILTVQDQHGVACLWVEIETTNDPEQRIIEIVGTGNKMEEHERKYISTFFQFPFVWHVYERIKI